MVGGGKGQLGLVFHCDEYSSWTQSTGWVVKSLPLCRMALAEGKQCINSSVQLNEGAVSLHCRLNFAIFSRNLYHLVLVV